MISEESLTLPFSKSILVINSQFNEDLKGVFDAFIKYFENLEYDILIAPIPPWRNPLIPLNDANVSRDESFILDGINCLEIVKIVARKLKANAGLSESVDILSIKILPFLKSYWQGLKKIITQIKPKFILIGGDYSPEHILTTMISEQLGIQVIALEISFLSNFFNVEFITGMCCNNNSYGTWKWHYIRNINLNEKDADSLHEFLRKRKKHLYNANEEIESSSFSPDRIRKQLSIGEEKKVALILSQLPHDCVISYDLSLFESLESLLVNSINSFKELDD